MRRFSQRNALVTLSDINVTPLLDLAFVLLIIFIIISPSIRPKAEQSLDLNLPKGGSPNQIEISPEDLTVVSITSDGTFFLGPQPMPLDALERELINQFARNPNMVVRIRGDEQSLYKYVAGVIDRCLKNGITRLSLQTDADTRPNL